MLIINNKIRDFLISIYDKLDSIYNHYLWEEIYIEIKRLPYNIIKLIQWSKIIWKDYDWDEIFIIYILEYKLKRMIKHFEDHYKSYCSYIGQENDVKNMKIVLEHIKRFKEPYHYSLPIGESNSRIEKDDKGNNWYKSGYNRHQKYLICTHYPQLEDYHWNRIWEIIRKKGRSWWI